MSSKTKVVFLLDESGSMAGISSSIKESFNGFIDSQKNIDGDASFALYRFGRDITCVTFSDIKNVKKLEEIGYFPNGGTPLYDAIGKAVNTEVTVGSCGILVILTDGEENQSRLFTKEMVTNIVDQIQKVNGWEVIFLGANIKDFHGYASMHGFKKDSTIEFFANKESIHEGYASINAAVTSYRNAHVSK